ncbi:hypothetical protein ACFQL4_26890 [Halosimplex aquaticum]
MFEGRFERRREVAVADHDREREPVDEVRENDHDEHRERRQYQKRQRRENDREPDHVDADDADGKPPDAVGERERSAVDSTVERAEEAGFQRRGDDQSSEEERDERDHREEAGDPDAARSVRERDVRPQRRQAGRERERDAATTVGRERAGDLRPGQQRRRDRNPGEGKRLRGDLDRAVESGGHRREIAAPRHMSSALTRTAARPWSLTPVGPRK